MYKKIVYILTKNQLKKLVFLTCFSLVGVIFEMVGIGILIPALTLILDGSSGNKFPLMLNIISFIGNPNRENLVIIFMTSIFVINLIKSFFLIWLTWVSANFSSTMLAYQSTFLFSGYLKMPYAFHFNKNSATIIRNIQSETTAFYSLISAGITLLIEVMLLVGILIMLFFVEPIGTLIAGFILIFFSIIPHTLSKKKLKKWGDNRQFISGLITKTLNESLGAIKEINLTNKQNYFINIFSENSDWHAKIYTKVNTIAAAPKYYLELLAIFGMSSISVIMILQHKPLTDLVPTLALFAASAFRIIPSISRILNSIQTITFNTPVVDVIYKETKMIRDNNLRLSMVNNISIEEKQFFNKYLELKDVAFCYNENLVLKNINLKINKGECIGIIGISGSGKTTLIDLVTGLLEPSKGELLIDGIKDIKVVRRNWQKNIGYVPQSIYLMDDTFYKNIAFGYLEDDIDKEKVSMAIKAAQLEDLINALPEGLNTKIGERGVRLSGGQRQRIGIARALYLEPKILVLDEATSSLDNKTENDFMNSVNNLRGTITIIIVSHRLTTLNNCDFIYKLKNGQLTEEILSNKH
jgi:ABC-type multidrug transport system fused ATPase/permease subunit